MGTIQTELVKKDFEDVLKQEIDKKNSNTSKKPKEKLTRKEIEELMGCNRDTFKRHHGAIRRR